MNTGLDDLADEKFARIGGDNIRNMGEPIGNGLTEQSAAELGLNLGTPVAVGIIDAHAGGVGLVRNSTSIVSHDVFQLGAPLGTERVTPELLEQRLALISGTSSCHMAASREPFFINGILSLDVLV